MPRAVAGSLVLGRRGMLRSHNVMRITFLGTGTSNGVPVVTCSCDVCRSANPRNRRTRTSILIESGETTVLVDAGPDFREQALREEITSIDAVLFTHAHADHTHGLDDLRPYCCSRPVHGYGDRATIDDLQRRFDYIVDSSKWTPGRPRLVPEIITPGRSLRINDLEILPVQILHGEDPILGFRIGEFAYLTDCKAIPAESYPLLDGVELLVLGALRYRRHPTHFSVEEAMREAERLGAAQTYLTHICHDIEHEQLSEELPAEVQPAHDGLAVEIEPASESYDGGVISKRFGT